LKLLSVEPADVERSWFTRRLLRQPDAPPLFDRSDDSDFFPLDEADWESDLAMWRSECAASRMAVAGRRLDDTGLRGGEEVSLRWVYVHMIEEYARHNGHADLIREMVDGQVGW
jgi:hypothetical protein